MSGRLLILNVGLLILAFATAIAAIGGETWKKGKGPVWSRITRRGWLSIVLYVLILLLGVTTEWVSQEELREKSNEIADLNRMIIATITGGDSYGYVVLTTPNAQQHSEAILLVDGDHPLYDVSVRVEDRDETRDSAERAIAENHPNLFSLFSNMQLKGFRHFQVGNIHPQVPIPLTSLDLSGRSEASFDFTIMARNGIVDQRIRFQRVDDQWKYGYKVTRGSEMLKEHGWAPGW